MTTHPTVIKEPITKSNELQALLASVKLNVCESKMPAKGQSSKIEQVHAK